MGHPEQAAAIGRTVGATLPGLIGPDDRGGHRGPPRVVRIRVPGQRCDAGNPQGWNRMQADRGPVLADPRLQSDVFPGFVRSRDHHPIPRPQAGRPTVRNPEPDRSLDRRARPDEGQARLSSGHDRKIRRKGLGGMVDPVDPHEFQIPRHGRSRPEGQGGVFGPFRPGKSVPARGTGSFDRQPVEEVARAGPDGHDAGDRRERLLRGPAEPGGLRDRPEGLGSVVREGFARHGDRQAPVGKRAGQTHRQGQARVGSAAGIEELPRPPERKALPEQLIGESSGVGRGFDRLGGQPPRGLVVAVLAGRGGRVHGDHHLGPQRPDEAHQSAERVVMAPAFEGDGKALGVGEIGLVEEVGLLHAQPPEGVAQFDFAQDSQGRTRLGSDHVAPALTAGAVDMGDRAS